MLNPQIEQRLQEESFTAQRFPACKVLKLVDVREILQEALEEQIKKDSEIISQARGTTCWDCGNLFCETCINGLSENVLHQANYWPTNPEALGAEEKKEVKIQESPDGEFTPNVVPCEKCGEHAIEPLNDTPSLCSECEEEPVPEEKKECPRCNGEGDEMGGPMDDCHIVTCKDCRGTGKSDESVSKENLPPGPERNEEWREEFFQYMSEGYSGGKKGLRCDECDAKYAGDSNLIQLCPLCMLRKALSAQKKKHDDDLLAIRKSVESAVHYGDLRETNLRNCLDNIFNKYFS